MRGPDLRRYAIAAAAVAAALVARWALQGVLGSKVPFLQFYPAIVAASWVGGLGPGLVATGVSALAAMWYLLPPDGFAVGDPGDQLSLVVFAGTGGLIAWLYHRVQLAEAARRAAADEASARLERLDAILNTKHPIGSGASAGRVPAQSMAAITRRASRSTSNRNCPVR